MSCERVYVPLTNVDQVIDDGVIDDSGIDDSVLIAYQKDETGNITLIGGTMADDEVVNSSDSRLVLNNIKLSRIIKLQEQDNPQQQLDVSELFDVSFEESDPDSPVTTQQNTENVQSVSENDQIALSQHIDYSHIFVVSVEETTQLQLTPPYITPLTSGLIRKDHVITHHGGMASYSSDKLVVMEIDTSNNYRGTVTKNLSGTPNSTYTGLINPCVDKVSAEVFRFINIILPDLDADGIEDILDTLDFATYRAFNRNEITIDEARAVIARIMRANVPFDTLECITIEVLLAHTN